MKPFVSIENAHAERRERGRLVTGLHYRQPGTTEGQECRGGLGRGNRDSRRLCAGAVLLQRLGQVVAKFTGAAEQPRQAAGIEQHERTDLLEARREGARDIDARRRRERRGK